MKLARSIPSLVLVVATVSVAMALRPAPQKDFHTTDFGKLPVLLNGRMQPLDSVARNSLMVIRNRQTVLLENRQSLPAKDWLLEVLAKPEVANTRKIFRIDHPELLDLVKLPQHEKYYSFYQLTNSIAALQQETERVSKIEDKLRTVYEKAVMKLANGMWLYDRLKNSLKPEGITNFAAELAEYEKSIKPGVAALQAREAGKSYEKADLEKLNTYFQRYQGISKLAYPLLVPPLQASKSREDWESIAASLVGGLRNGEIHPAVRHYAALAGAYYENKPAEFNKAVAEYRGWLEQHNFVPELKKTRMEVFFNSFQPFYQALSLYVVVFLCACFSWLRMRPEQSASDWLRRSAFYLMGLALVVHTFGLVMRMVLEGRPPVTNLYSSAVFIGWGAAVLGLILERFYRDGIGLVTGSALGFVTLLVAHHLALISPTGDTMEMLRAVLDTNFWLATHVVTITMGYSANFVAGFLAVLFIVRGVFTRSLSHANAEGLSRMVYGIVCFATLFSFIGTVLGGIWADQSWGRFWGWDPKENGALLIVLWNAAILHSRWGGLIKQRGLMNMAIFGNIVTSFSWFGVNMLGIGLHSYGFMDQAFLWLVGFVSSQLGLIVLGMLPEKYWKSFRNSPAGSPPGAVAGPEVSEERSTSMKA